MTKTVDRYVELPAELTDPIDPPPIPDARMSWGQIADLGVQYRSNWLQCEAQKREARSLQGRVAEGGGNE